MNSDGALNGSLVIRKLAMKQLTQINLCNHIILTSALIGGAGAGAGGGAG